MKNRRAVIGLGIAGAVLLALQLVPVPRTNPPVTGEIDAPPDVKAVLRRSCWDCHSNETVWPWYAKVAPVSFLVSRDTVQGRKHLNFSEWSSYSPTRQKKKLEETAKEVDEGEMPMAIYLPMHPEAKLSAADKALLVEWARKAAASSDTPKP